MRYFQTDKNGFYVGEFVADPSPRETGAYLVPAGGVVDAPPVAGAGQIARRVGNAWALVPDRRGSVYWLADHSRHEITEPGIDFPAGALMADPPLSAAEIAKAESDQAKRDLAALDLASIRSMREYIAAKADAPQILKDKEAAAQAARVKVR